MKQVFSAHQLCEQDGPWARISNPTTPRCVVRLRPADERGTNPLVVDSAAGWPSVESRRRTLPPSCSGRTFAREHDGDVRRETIFPLCSDCWSC